MDQIDGNARNVVQFQDYSKQLGNSTSVFRLAFNLGDLVLWKNFCEHVAVSGSLSSQVAQGFKLASQVQGLNQISLNFSNQVDLPDKIKI